MTRIYVPLDHEQRRALLQYAEKQYRDPRIQAALFIQRGLEQAGALPQKTAVTETAVSQGGDNGSE